MLTLQRCSQPDPLSHRESTIASINMSIAPNNERDLMTLNRSPPNFWDWHHIWDPSAPAGEFIEGSEGKILLWSNKDE